jgi:hypothetical protein
MAEQRAKPTPPTNGVKFRKGQSGNPAGRPKLLLTQTLRALMTDDDRETIVRAVIDKARGGDLASIAMVFDRLEGKPVQRNENSGPDGGPQQFEHQFEQLSDEQIVDVLKAAVAE